MLRWTGSAPDVDVLPSGRIRAAVDGLVIDQPTAAEWFVEVEPEGVHLGTKWLARARIVLRHAQELHVESAQETTQRPVATGPAVVTIATRDLEVTDLLEGREVSHRGDDTEHDLRIHVQVLPGSGGSAEESRADVQGREATPRSTYTWVLSEEGPGVACCVTVVAGVGPDEVLRRLG
ncbi:MAG TPA: hypothetical protein VNS46_18465, partial [Nocardioides sp.]|nr:hypothetical protein [Nocardioides sp.]